MIRDEETIQALVATVERFVAERLRPLEAEVSETDQIPPDVVQDMREMGLFGLTIPEEFGGLGLTMEEEVRVMMALGRTSPAFRSVIGTTVGIGSQGIVFDGTAEQKAQWLPRLATGEVIASFALTEPGSGSDAASLRTTAIRDGDHYVVNGSKTWITNSLHGHGTLLLVKTDPNAQPRHKGMSMLIAEKGDGFVVANKLKKMGYRAIDTCELVFDNYRVPAENLLGGVEGKGFLQTAGGLELGRINVAARGAGIAEGALKLSLRYAQERHTFGKPICEHQAIQLKLAAMATQTEGAKRLIEQAARKYDAGERCDLEAAMAKLAGSEAGAHCAQEGMRIFGGYSYSVEYDIERFYRDAMLMCIGEGANEILSTVIAKQLVDRHRI